LKHYDIANIPGDGVGQEVAREALKVFDAAAKKFGFKVSYENYDWGCDYYLKHGEMNPANMLETLKGSDAIRFFQERHQGRFRHPERDLHPQGL
jgi:tartrate dehydrogenase/decarboxylase / D-malate dehydrogenase